MKPVKLTPFSGKITVLLVAVLALLGPGQLVAQTAVSNLSYGTTNTTFPVGQVAPDYRQVVFSFTTGAAAVNFAGISLIFGPYKAGNPGALTFGLYDTTFNTSNATGTLLTPLTTSGNPLVAGTYSFTGSASLAANTTYYLKLSADSAPAGYNYFDVPFSTSTAETGLTGWTIGNVGYQYKTGVYYSTESVPPRLSSYE